MKRFALSLAVAVLAAGPAVAGDPQIVFAPWIERDIGRIDALEQRQEARFRAFRNDRGNERETLFHFNRSVYAGTEWAGERLIPRLEDFTLANLTRALIAYDLDRVAPERRHGTVRLTIDRMKIANYDLARHASHSTYIKGRVERLDDATGAVLEAHDVTANFVRYPTVERSYSGDDLVFYTFDPDTRVGPILAQFVGKALGRLYPDADFARVLITVETRDS